MKKPVPEDESRDIYRIPDSVKRLVESGAKGAKAGKGFYQKVGRDILSVDLVHSSIGSKLSPAPAPALGPSRPVDFK